MALTDHTVALIPSSTAPALKALVTWPARQREFVARDERRPDEMVVGAIAERLSHAGRNVPASAWSHKSRAMVPFGSRTLTVAAPSRTQEATISQSESSARRTALENDAA